MKPARRNWIRIKKVESGLAGNLPNRQEKANGHFEAEGAIGDGQSGKGDGQWRSDASPIGKITKTLA